MSEGKWHEMVPKERLANLEFRLRFLRLCRRSAGYRRAALWGCGRDVVFFVCVFGWQYNPRESGSEVGPFVTWDFQEGALVQTLDRMFGGYADPDVLWEKSRELGATWLALFMDSWLCLFHDWKKVFAISHSEQAVDRADDADSLFWKVNYINGHLPGWMSRGVKKRKLGFSYAATRSSFTGAATSERSGVGGRGTTLTLDEFSKHRSDFEILGQTADVGPRLFIGTHYGLEKAFYHLTQRPDLFKIVMHWSQHPKKRRGLYRVRDGRVEVLDVGYVFPPDYPFVRDGSPTGGPYPGVRSPWYDAECVRRASARDVAMHLDINPTGAQSQFFEPQVIRVLMEQGCRRAVWEGEPRHASGRPTGMEAKAGGHLEVWVHPKRDGSMPAGRYAVGVDIAAGTGASPSCVSVVDVETGEKVAAYVNVDVDPTAFAGVVAAIGRLFVDREGREAMVAWEASGGVGESFAKPFLALGYRNVWYRETPMSYAGMRKHSDKPGWFNRPETVVPLLTAYRAALAQRRFVNRCEWALKETLSFRYAGNTVEHPEEKGTNDPSGARVNHGDRVIADALAWMVCAKLVAVAAPAQPTQTIPQGSLAWRRQYHREWEESEVDG